MPPFHDDDGDILPTNDPRNSYQSMHIACQPAPNSPPIPYWNTFISPEPGDIDDIHIAHRLVAEYSVDNGRILRDAEPPLLDTSLLCRLGTAIQYSEELMKDYPHIPILKQLRELLLADPTRLHALPDNIDIISDRNCPRRLLEFLMFKPGMEGSRMDWDSTYDFYVEKRSRHGYITLSRPERGANKSREGFGIPFEKLAAPSSHHGCNYRVTHTSLGDLTCLIRGELDCEMLATDGGGNVLTPVRTHTVELKSKYVHSFAEWERQRASEQRSHWAQMALSDTEFLVQGLIARRYQGEPTMLCDFSTLRFEELEGRVFEESPRERNTVLHQLQRMLRTLRREAPVGKTRVRCSLQNYYGEPRVRLSLF
mmetsp:Transcript_36779/g.68410  ORF Transcript_36779/g.68410 Transcript_36779/m.68410 type:complete len:368 (-) Transcript_36779:174-1277(-)